MPLPPADSTVPRTVRPTDSASEAAQLYLRAVYSENHALELPSPPRFVGHGRPLIIGRAPVANDDVIVLRDDKHASRAHTRVSAYDVGGDRGLLIEDLRSRNGTYVDGEAIDRRVATAGDVLRIGGTLFVVGDAPPNAQHNLASASQNPDVVLRSWPMLQLWSKLMRVAPSNGGVLLLGETGVGKTMLAKQIHQLSARADGPFVRHNCGSIPKNLEDATLFGVVGGFVPEVKARDGLLTRARRGTLFLDELADLHPVAQAKLLDAFDPTDPSYLAVGGVQRLATDCRLVAATNRDLFALEEHGVVRRDLLSRLVVTQLVIPPLRERREAIVELFCLAASEQGGAERLLPTVEIAEALLIAPWVENVRGLRSLAQRAALGERLTVDLVDQHAGRGGVPAEPTSPPARAAVHDAHASPRGWPPDEQQLLATLDEHGWCVADAAAAYGKRRETLARLIRRYFGPGGKQHAFRAFRAMTKRGDSE